MSALTEKAAAANQQAFDRLKERQKDMNQDRSHQRLLSSITKDLGLDKGYFNMDWESEKQALTNAMGMTCVGIYPHELPITDVIVHGWGSRIPEAFLDRWDSVPDEELPACMVFKPKGMRPLFAVTDAEMKFDYAVPFMELTPGILPHRDCPDKFEATAAADRPFYVMTLEMFAKAWTGSYLSKEELV